jgi:hypothetical protein
MGSFFELGVERRSERWSLRPLERPRLARYCPGCGVIRELQCSGKFRVNAQKKALDVWLKYRCEHCDSAWKAPIFERRPLSQMDPALLEAFERDEPTLVDRYAFEASRWRAHVVSVVAPSIEVDRAPVECACDEAARLCIHVEARFDCDMRLDRLLSTQLGLGRAELYRLHEAGQVQVTPSQRDALRRPVRNAQRVRFFQR